MIEECGCVFLLRWGGSSRLEVQVDEMGDVDSLRFRASPVETGT